MILKKKTLLIKEGSQLAQEHAAPIHGKDEGTTTGLSHRKMLMWAFLGSDCMFFGFPDRNIFWYTKARV